MKTKFKCIPEYPGESKGYLHVVAENKKQRMLVPIHIFTIRETPEKDIRKLAKRVLDTIDLPGFKVTPSKVNRLRDIFVRFVT